MKTLFKLLLSSLLLLLATFAHSQESSCGYLSTVKLGFNSFEDSIDASEVFTVNAYLRAMDTISIDTIGGAIISEQSTAEDYQAYPYELSNFTFNLDTGITYLPGDSVPFSFNVEYDKDSLPFDLTSVDT